MPRARSSPAGEPSRVTCGCAAHERRAEALPHSNGARKAVSVDEGVKRQNLNRLRRIEGQVRGLQQMVEGDRYCSDILVQIASVQEALRGVGRALLRNHLRHCVTNAIAKGGGEADAMYDELVQLFDRHGK